MIEFENWTFRGWKERGESYTRVAICNDRRIGYGTSSPSPVKVVRSHDRLALCRTITVSLQTDISQVQSLPLPPALLDSPLSTLIGRARRQKVW